MHTPDHEAPPWAQQLISDVADLKLTAERTERSMNHQFQEMSRSLAELASLCVRSFEAVDARFDAHDQRFDDSEARLPRLEGRTSAKVGP